MFRQFCELHLLLQEPALYLFVVRDRERGGMTRLGQNNVIPGLTANPAACLECTCVILARRQGKVLLAHKGLF